VTGFAGISDHNHRNPRCAGVTGIMAGRKFLASRLLLLGDQQIRDLFRAARAERRGGTVDEWVRVFKWKRDEIVKARCPAR
jgi:hypothetical protein